MCFIIRSYPAPKPLFVALYWLAFRPTYSHLLPLTISDTCITCCTASSPSPSSSTFLGKGQIQHMFVGTFAFRGNASTSECNDLPDKTCYFWPFRWKTANFSGEFLWVVKLRGCILMYYVSFSLENNRIKSINHNFDQILKHKKFKYTIQMYESS